ncbi:hypothetical protein ACF1G0_08595 [Streptomyces sp. NPDC013953]|uniref:hypothetical protein n=1 Tax=Streptomyces sp. NPDC013953 TaxID=3364868 RepID=UPI0036FEF012
MRHERADDGPRRPRGVGQHRRALRVTLALPALAAAVTAGLREWVAGSMDEARCLAGEPEACGAQLFGARVTPRGFLALALQWSLFALMAVPPLLGAFVAGPMVAREPESGTHQVAWTQSVTPARRLAAKLLLAAVLTAVFRFARKPVLFHEDLGRADRGAYEAMGPALGAYRLLGVGAYAHYHPVSAFRPVQLLETGVVLTLGCLAAYAAFRVLRRHCP